MYNYDINILHYVKYKVKYFFTCKCCRSTDHRQD